MHTYVAQTAYPTGEDIMYGPVLCVGSEWNRVMKQVMTHFDRDLYTNSEKIGRNTWRIHIDGDLYVDVTKFVVDEPISE